MLCLYAIVPFLDIAILIKFISGTCATLLRSFRGYSGPYFISAMHCNVYLGAAELHCLFLCLLLPLGCLPYLGDHIVSIDL